MALHQATSGLQAVHERILERRARGRDLAAASDDAADRARACTDMLGHLRVGKDMPLLHGRYRWQREIGRGGFSQIVLARDEHRGGDVAIKVMNAKYGDIGKQEGATLRRLRRLDPLNASRMVTLLGVHEFGRHVCLVFERLHGTLIDYMREQGKTFGVEHIRIVAVDMLASLLFMHRHDSIHADLKPENVMFAEAVDGAREPQHCRVKLVDFGNTMKRADTHAYHSTFELQSPYYRAPEVFFGVKTMAHGMDMWSLGCILAELFTGHALFASPTAGGVVARMAAVLGPLPRAPFARGKFFAQHKAHTSHSDNEPSRLARCKLLVQAIGCRHTHFIDFLHGLLAPDPATRLTARTALAHPFVQSVFPFGWLMDGGHSAGAHAGETPPRAFGSGLGTPTTAPLGTDPGPGGKRDRHAEAARAARAAAVHKAAREEARQRADKERAKREKEKRERERHEKEERKRREKEERERKRREKEERERKRREKEERERERREKEERERKRREKEERERERREKEERERERREKEERERERKRKREERARREEEEHARKRQALEAAMRAREEEAARLEAELRRAAAAEKRAAEEKRRKAAEKRRREEEKRRREEEEEERRREEERHREEERRRAAAEEKRRRRREEQLRMMEEERRAAEAEAEAEEEEEEEDIVDVLVVNDDDEDDEHDDDDDEEELPPRAAPTTSSAARVASEDDDDDDDVDDDDDDDEVMLL